MGFCNGMMIEGGSRWGYDPIWVQNEKPKEIKTADDKAVKEKDDESEDKPTSQAINANFGPEDIEN